MSSSRQLAAIMFTDIVGYTGLMGRDEQKAFELLKKNRQIQKPLIEQFNGKWIKELGDGVIASFNTVSDAVNAAIKIQQTCNASKDFQLRIGIHLGEVLFENDDVFGDGVNIASRIQALANPGSIYLSEAVHNSIANKKEFQTKFTTEQKLKNVKKPVKIYQVIAEGIVAAHTAPITEKIKKNRTVAIISLVALILLAATYFYTNSKKTSELNEKSIAILPFDDMSPQKDQEYLSDGLAEEIINSIAIIKNLKVIGRTSSFQYKGKGLDAVSIGKKLNVSNVLGGSIQIADNVLRITTTLIRVKDNKVIWSQRFDKEPKDIFAIQDSIANNIVEKLKVTLSESEKPRLVKKETDPEVYAEYLKGFLLYKREEFGKSIDYFLRAISGDSLFAPAHAYLALAKIWTIYRAGAFADYTAIREAKEYAYNSIRLDPDLAEAYSALALSAWIIELDFVTAKINFEKSIELNPSASLIKNRYAYFLLWMGEFDKAEKLSLDAISSDPGDYNGYIIVSSANKYKRNFKKAENYINEGQRLFPERPAFDNLNLQNKFSSGSYDEVIRIVSDRLEKNPENIDPGLLGLLSISYFKKGNISQSENIMKRLNEKTRDRNTSIDYILAKNFLQYKMYDSCFVHLERSFENREPDFKLLKIDPLLQSIKQDQRYQDLYRRYGFDRYK
ncbi:MAG TPA: adenylate/guanylate cyclase domain-containing protein [Chitinophagaceae bacterium]|nr:adenylate/guanylate cyclase domain-containing protein [Chitinophagaceae bacterium]